MNYVVTIDIEIVGQMGYMLPSKVLILKNYFLHYPLFQREGYQMQKLCG